MNICVYVNSQVLEVYNCTLTTLIWISKYLRFLPKNGTTIVAQLQFGTPRSHFIWLCGSWPHLRQLKKYIQSLVLIGKSKKRQCKIFPIIINMLEDITRKSFHCFPFSDVSYVFFTLFQSKIVHMY